MATQKAETKRVAVFQPGGLRTLGAGVWIYRSDSEKPEALPADFWKPAKQNYGMKEGDLVFFVYGKQPDMVVV